MEGVEDKEHNVGAKRVWRIKRTMLERVGSRG